MQYIVTMKRKREILFNFWLTEKSQWNWSFKPGKEKKGKKERKKEKLESEKSLVKTNDEQEIKGYREVSPGASRWPEKKSTLEKWKFLC